MYLISRIISIIGGFIVTVLGLRLLLMLLGANDTNQIVNFIYSVSAPFVQPFFGMFNYTPTYGVSKFEFATFIAIIFYGIVVGVISFIFAPPRTTTTI